MSGSALPAARERAAPVDPGDALAPRQSRRRWAIAAVVLVLIGACAAAAAVSGVLTGRGGRGSGDNGSATSLATVQRRSLSTSTQFNGSLGYGGSYAVLAQAHGTVTWLPNVGQVVRQGQTLYRVDGAPVVLLYGTTPAYRALAAGARAADVTGTDVAQLNHDLIALGYVRSSDVDAAWDEFNWATRAGVERLQKHLGMEQTGRLDLGDAVFLPTAARVTTLQATLGGPAAGPVLSASSTARTVSVALDADLQSEVSAGDRVTVTLPDGSTTPGVVTSVGRVATVSSNNAGGSGGSGSGPTVPVYIRPTDLTATGSLDRALVEVSITDRSVHDVLAVQVTALVALAGSGGPPGDGGVAAAGGYAVEVVAGDGTHHLVPVTPGLFDDTAGMVQVSGSGLSAGQRVVVPGNE